MAAGLLLTGKSLLLAIACLTRKFSISPGAISVPTSIARESELFVASTSVSEF
ncbi:hypothetical protein IQ255_02275 [Pleurocapsales cyanobacterium LEGE 10410]|nr:hypothetical protein [Pleurocapsales cyanobacterium LEGE 10410]